MCKSVNNDKMDRQVYTVDEIKQILGIPLGNHFERALTPKDIHTERKHVVCSHVTLCDGGKNTVNKRRIRHEE